ncbi:MAG: GAF domain-containing protein [Solirubrobacteraceae bacterium]
MSEHDETLLRLIDVGQALVAELDPEAVLDRILREAREMTGAEFAALGILGEDRQSLTRFLTSGVDDATRRAIGEPPVGRGVLGTLIKDPHALRLANVTDHPHSYGFPSNHPPMRSFLGVPILIRGQAWGNLYLCDKADGSRFTDADEDAVTILAQWAATAIENARLYADSESRRIQAERAVRALQAAQDIADAIGSVAELERVLELIVKRGRALVEAQSVLILLREGDELVVAACAGHAPATIGSRLPIRTSIVGQVLKHGQPQRVAGTATNVQPVTTELGLPSAQSVLLVPMFHRSAGIGVLIAVDRGTSGDYFHLADEQLLRTFAASASNAVAIKRSVEADRLHAAIAAAEAERRRWARELHDQTLQALAALRLMLAAAARHGDADASRQAVQQAIKDIEAETENLRGIIMDLRPSLLDDLGLAPALEALIDRRRQNGLQIEAELDIPTPGDGIPLLEAELSTTIYRLVQEALTNIVKHAHATTCLVVVRADEDLVKVQVTDDGQGYDTSSRGGGFGLAGMRERVYLADGTIDFHSSEHGTTVSARLPVKHLDAGVQDA